MFFFFSSRRRHTRFSRDWSSDVCSSDLAAPGEAQLELLREVTGVDGPGDLVLDQECVELGRDLAEVSELRHARLHHFRSEERRVGKECRSRWSPHHEKKKLNRDEHRRTE